MQPCLDESTILAFGQGSVDAATKKRVEDHIAECEECRSLAMQVVRSSSMVPKAAPIEEQPPESEPPAAAPEPEPERAKDPSVIQAPPSVAPPSPGVNRVVLALAAIIVLIGAGAAVSLMLH